MQMHSREGQLLLHCLMMVGYALPAETSSTDAGAVQEDVRDEPLTSLQLPLMFVRGTNDPFSTQDPWDKLRPRLTTKHLLVSRMQHLCMCGCWQQSKQWEMSSVY
jgi:predicted alpha/beta-hydrolase family hydrolase